MTNLIKIISIAAFTFSTATFASQGNGYLTNCKVDDGVAIATLETDSSSLSVNGEVRVETFDRWGNSVGSISAYKRENLRTYSTKTVMVEPIDWFVKSCSFSIERASVEVVRRERNRGHKVVVYEQAPKIVVGFPFPEILSTHTTIHTHVHDRWCGHNHVTIRHKKIRRPHHKKKVVIRTNGRDHQRRNNRVIIKTKKKHRGRPHRSDSRKSTIIKVSHKS